MFFNSRGTCSALTAAEGFALRGTETQFQRSPSPSFRVAAAEGFALRGTETTSFSFM